MYLLKQLPEDFAVQELPNLNRKDDGPYLYFQLAKRNYNTIDAVQKIARCLHLKERQIGFSGNKDKRAVTEQAISIIGKNQLDIESLKITDLALKFLGRGEEPITLGSHQGNWFEIMIRNLDREIIEKTSFLENYFAEQRFSQNNARIGRNLVKKKFLEAAELIDNDLVKEHLQHKPGDAVGALRRVSKRLLRLYVNAYQSYLWNETVRIYLQGQGAVIRTLKYSWGELTLVGKPNFKLKIPLLGFDSGEIENQKLDLIIDKMMEAEKLSNQDFIIKQIPELSVEGELRNVFVKVKGLSIGPFKPDELNPGRKKVKVRFSLPKGSYATMLIRKMIREKRSKKRNFPPLKLVS